MDRVHDKLISSGYVFTGHTESGDRYVRESFTIYHSGHMLVVIRGRGMIRTFPEDRLAHFSVEDIEKQAGILPRNFDGKEDRTNYDYPTKRRP